MSENLDIMNSEKEFWGMNEKMFLTMMNISQLIGGVGFVLPIVMWLTYKDQSEKIDEQGKVIVNWIISALIYASVSAILIFIFIGVIGIVAVGLLCVIFPIKGAIEANNDEIWTYPLSINFLK